MRTFQRIAGAACSGLTWGGLFGALALNCAANPNEHTTAFVVSFVALGAIATIAAAHHAWCWFGD